MYIKDAKVGSKVACVRTSKQGFYGTAGVEYTITEINSNGMRLSGQEECDPEVSGERFELIPQLQPIPTPQLYTTCEMKISASTLSAPAQVTGGVKHDGGKAPCELLSPAALLGTSQVLAFGAKKYAANNWRQGLAWARIIGAIMRHLFAFMQGEDLDPETGLPHVDHLGCEVMFLQELYRTRKDLDDRYKPAPSNEAPKLNDSSKGS